MRKLVVLMTLGLLALSVAHAETEYDSVEYVDIVYGDQEESPYGWQKQARTGLRKETVIKADSRVRVFDTSTYPHSAIVQVGDFCSGAVIGEHHVLTAGHCLYNPRTGKWDKSAFTVTPGKSGSQRPFGTFRAQKACVPTAWSRRSNDAYDLAILTFERPIGNFTGWFGTWGNKNAERSKVNIASYPGDKAGDKQWQQYCKSRASSSFLYHQCDTHGGSSGAPVYLFYQDKGERYIIGVHEGGHSRRENRAVRLSGGAWDFVDEFID